MSEVSSTNLPSNMANFSDSETEEMPTTPFPPVSPSDESARDRLLRLRRRKTMATPSLPSRSVVTQSRDYDGDRESWWQWSLPNMQQGMSSWLPQLFFIAFMSFIIFIAAVYCYKAFYFAPTVVDTGADKTPTADQELADIIEKINTPICEAKHLTEANPLCLQSKDHIKPAFLVIREIHKVFEDKIVDYYCEEGDKTGKDPSYIGIVELKKHIRNQMYKNGLYAELEDLPADASKPERDAAEISRMSNIGRAFEDAIVLIELNPKTKMVISHHPATGHVDGIRVNPVTYPAEWPSWCRLRLQLQTAASQLLVYGTVILISCMIYKFVNHRKELRTREEALFLDLIEKSIELLQSPDEPRSCPVVHIRDSLLSPAERKQAIYMRAWERVVKEVESKESRVQPGTENINGELFKTWKWVAARSPGRGSTAVMRTGNIEWQGQAFNEDSTDLMAGTRRPTSQPRGEFQAPTAFLKVRHMFDQNYVNARPESWRSDVIRAILEKCSDGIDAKSHGILHLVVDERDPNEGLVYMRCKDIPSASKAFLSLHGWWCDYRLVSVRFLKDVRYYSRFPEAEHATEPLSYQPLVEDE